MEFNFRPLKHSDLQLLAEWLSRPYVSRWWKELATLEHVTKEYGPCIDGTEPTDAYIVSAKNKPLGFIQSYRISDYPEYANLVNIPNSAGLDFFIGEQLYTGKGYGAQTLTQFIEKVLKNKYKGIVNVIADPEVENIASIRTLERAGFIKGDIVSGEHGPAQLMTKNLT